MTPDSREARKLLRRYLQSLLIWNPLITGAFAFTFGSFEFFAQRWAVSLVIATVITQFCWGGIMVTETIENLGRKAFGRPERVYGKMTTVSLSILFMFVGLPFGFQAGGIFARMIGRPWNPPGWNDYKVASLIGIAICAFFVLWEYWRNSETRVRQLENDNLKSQLNALTNQMNPHFLFNALNTIASLIPSDPARAEEMTVRFSDLYRAILGSGASALHPLSRELDLCRAYLEIEQSRMGERLSFAIEAAPELEQVEVPALLLQPLVENAIKHGIASRSSGGRVLVRALPSEGNGLVLDVEDDGVGFGNSTHRNGSGTTLRNCRSRLELLYPRSAEMQVGPAVGEGSGSRVRIRLPGGGARA